MVILVLTSTIVSDDGVTQLVKVTSPAGSGKRFMRLRVNKTALAEISIQQTAGTSLVRGAEVWSRSFLAQHRLFMDYFIETAFGIHSAAMSCALFTVTAARRMQPLLQRGGV